MHTYFLSATQVRSRAVWQHQNATCYTASHVLYLCPNALQVTCIMVQLIRFRFMTDVNMHRFSEHFFYLVWRSLASYPGSRGGGERRAWYTLFAHAQKITAFQYLLSIARHHTYKPQMDSFISMALALGDQARPHFTMYGSMFNRS